MYAAIIARLAWQFITRTDTGSVRVAHAYMLHSTQHSPVACYVIYIIDVSLESVGRQGAANLVSSLSMTSSLEDESSINWT